MANNRIQIKRSAGTATPTSLQAGELAYSNATGGSGVLFIGSTDGGTVVPIAGVRNPGTLTANQALVANSTSGINSIIVGNVVFSGASQSLNINGSTGTAGYVLVSNGAANAYWTSPSTIGAVNTSAQYAWTNSHTWFANLVVNSTAIIWVGNTTSSPTITLANTGAFTIGNSTTTETAAIISVANSTGNVQITPGTTSILATGSINAVSYNTGATGTGTGGLIANVTTLFVGNNTINTVITSAGLTVNGTATIANSTGIYTGVVNGSSITVGTNFIANTTKVTFTGANIDATAALLSVNNVTTSADLSVKGNTSLGDATSDVVSFTARVNTSIVPSSNQIYDLGSNTLRWGAVYANTLTVTGTTTIGGNVSVDGTLTVTGNVITQNVQSVIVSDPMIYLAGNNYTSDLVDIGLAGNYNDGVTNRHTGLFRDHTDGIWKLFYNLTQELSGNNDVDTSDPSYRTATLVAYLSSGGLSTNTTSANLVANSTYSVGIIANTLTLSTALVGTSGGTGKSTVTNNALLVGNSTNGYNELTLGTSGYVLQSNGTAIVYDYLDGGTF